MILFYIEYVKKIFSFLNILLYNTFRGENMGINEVIQVGSRIKKYRKSKGITQKEVARLAGIPYSTYSNYENNNREPNEEQLRKIASALGTSEVELLGLTKEEFLKPLEDEVAFLNYLLSLGYEYVDTFYNNDFGFDRCIYITKENTEIPLTKEEYEHLRDSIINDTETEIYKLRKQRGI